MRASADHSSVALPVTASTTAITTSTAELAAERAVGGEGRQQRTGIGEPAGLDHDPAEIRDVAALALGNEAAQRDLQVGARGAAHAAIAEQDGFLAALSHQLIVDPDRAELVDDDGGAAALGRREKALEQRGLAGAEKAGEDGHRNARSARAPQPSTERPGSARREEVLHFGRRGPFQKSISRM